MFRRMVFNYYLPNKDDHLKNTSFIYHSSINGYKLSLCYDITKTDNLDYHQLLCNNKEKPTDEDFLIIAKKFNLNKQRCIDIIRKIKIQCKG